MKKNIISKIFLITFIVIAIAVLIPIGYNVSIKIKQQTSKNDIYKIINDAYIYTSRNNIKGSQIFKVKNNNVKNIFNNLSFNIEKSNYEGYIMINQNRDVAIQLKSSNYCTIKDFNDSDITFVSKCEKLKIGGEILYVEHPFLDGIIKQPVDELFTFPNISLGDDLDKQFDIDIKIKKGDKEVKELSTNNIGDKYTISYNITNDINNIQFEKKVRVVIVEDKNSPKIETDINKNNNETIVSITTDVPNIVNIVNPISVTKDKDTSSAISFIEKTSEYPFDLYHFVKSGTAEEWNGFINEINSTVKKGDYIVISGYYKTTDSISAIDAGFTPVTKDIKEINAIDYSKRLSVIADNNWHYYYKTIKINEDVTNPVVENGWAFSNSPGTLYLSRISIRIIPKNIANTALDIHIKKYEKGVKDEKYFKNSGILINDNKFTVTDSGLYTIYVEDANGNSTTKMITIE